MGAPTEDFDIWHLGQLTKRAQCSMLSAQYLVVTTTASAAAAAAPAASAAAPAASTASAAAPAATAAPAAAVAAAAATNTGTEVSREPEHQQYRFATPPSTKSVEPRDP